MDDQQNIDFSEFEEAFSGDGNQTEAEEEQIQAEEQPQEAQEAAEADESEDSGEETQQPEESAQQPEQQPTQEEKPAEVFTLKVNKEEKTYSREEMVALAQKGVDYDRVKSQLEKSRSTLSALDDLAKASNLTTEQLLENLQIAKMRQQDGVSEEVARERLARQRAERELEEIKNSSDASDNRAKKEIAEFRSAYPDVEITQELIAKLMPEVTEGKSLLSVYRKQEQAAAAAIQKQKDDRIAELERQLAAEKQNKENRAASPGSQKDTGGKRSKNEFDEFLAAFN